MKIALVAVALSPVPPALPKKELKAGGSSASAFGLLVAAALFGRRVRRHQRRETAEERHAIQLGHLIDWCDPTQGQTRGLCTFGHVHNVCP